MSDVPSRAAHRLAVYAVGGNALSDPAASGEEANVSAQRVMDAVMSDVVDLLESGFRVVLTHGNGPQVGEMLLMEEALYDRHSQDAEAVEPRTAGIDHWVAATQGTLGHEIATRLDGVLTARGRHEQVATLLTRVVVDADDSAFDYPTKPIGPFIDDIDAVPSHWEIGVAKGGPRRVVASPMPQSIVDADAINALLGAGAVVLCAGGGGIPVISNSSGFDGVEAVVDKDRVTALMAVSIEADLLVISTAVDCIKFDFGKESERSLFALSIADGQRFLDEGQFPAGSMGPKVEAMLDAKKARPQLQVVLCQPGAALAAMRGEAGTNVVN